MNMTLCTVFMKPLFILYRFFNDGFTNYNWAVKGIMHQLLTTYRLWFQH